MTRRSVVSAPSGYRIRSPLLNEDQSTIYSGFLLARRTTVELFPKTEEFSMNRSTLSSSNKKVSLSISKAIDGFLKFKIAEGLSQRTVDSYKYYLNQWMNHIGDQDVANINTSDLITYFAWIHTEYNQSVGT
ncbi:MAG: phage integrase N-terminal SAM-like domain-containing protein [Anaerolineaceae bacterium]|nr:phage integrase N-terminal SAM-like domain-containing protein [Anaerolineaceae bacterium]